MSAVAVYTAVFGGYDELHPQADQDVDVDWIAFTDVAGAVAPPWRVVPLPTFRHGDSPRMAAKWFKCLPWRAMPHTQSIWVDANTEVTAGSFAREALASMHDGIALFRHPDRKCIYDEAAASLRLAPIKYGHLPILEQAEHYRSLGHPARSGLYACGTIARDHSASVIRQLGRRWLDECDRWTYQDQLSLPVVCAELGVRPGVFPLAQVTRGRLGNRWFTIHPHRSDR